MRPQRAITVRIRLLTVAFPGITGERFAAILALIRLRGHNPKGGYDVHNVRDETEAKPAERY